MRIAGHTIRNWRQMHHFTQTEVADRMFICQQDYSKWERKEWVSADFLLRFETAMNCKIEDLLSLQYLYPPDSRKKDIGE